MYGWVMLESTMSMNWAFWILLDAYLSQNDLNPRWVRWNAECSVYRRKNWAIRMLKSSPRVRVRAHERLNFTRNTIQRFPISTQHKCWQYCVSRSNECIQLVFLFEFWRNWHCAENADMLALAYLAYAYTHTHISERLKAILIQTVYIQ